jgi:hypothetical protein
LYGGIAAIARPPRRLERYVASNDPDFEAKAADVIGAPRRKRQHRQGTIERLDGRLFVETEYDRVLGRTVSSTGRDVEYMPQFVSHYAPGMSVTIH